MSVAEERTAVERAALVIQELTRRLEAAERARSEPVAVVGIGCAFPGGADCPGAYWRLLAQGRDLVTTVPPDRWDVDALWDPDPAAPGRIYTNAGSFLEGVDRFDAAFFGISPREAERMDPQHRLLLEVAWQALEDAGIDPRSLRGSATGVFLGVGTSGYVQLSLAHGLEALETYDGTGNGASFAAGRISHFLGLQGPALSLDTACSSSLVAVHQAVGSLRRGECDRALVGGVQLGLTPEASVFLSRARAFSPTGRCRTFDAGADGMVRGEGCGVIVLERAGDAQAAGRPVLGLIRGTAVNHDGPSSGLTVPNPGAQVRVIRGALRDAGLQPDAVDYVEAHGTGTPLGDPIELEALAEVFQGRPAPVAIGSVKTNLGHLEAAAGIAGLIKAVLALRSETLPPHLHLRQPTGMVDWDALPLRVVTEPEPWPRRDGRPRIAGVSSFGMSGTNAHVVLEEAPAIPVDAPPPPNPARDAHVVLVSARSESAVRAQGRRWAEWMESDGAGVPLREIGYTSHALRAAFEHRAFAVGGDAAEIAAALRELQPGGRAGAEPPRIAAVFPGQGAQHAGMAEALYQQSAIFRDAVARCSEAMRPELGFGIEEVLYGDLRDRIGGTEYAQPALYAVEWGLWEVLRASGVKVGAVLGHSVGEYVAAAAAGWLDVEEGARWIVRRGKRMASCGGCGGMAAVIGERAEVERHLEPGIVVAAQNGPREVTISGEREALSRVVARLESAGHGARELRVSDGFHSACMEPMSREWADAVASMRIRPNPDGGVRLRSSVTGAWADEGMARGRYWADQVMRPVEYWRGVRGLVEDGFGVVVEVGPDAALTGVGRRSGLGEVRWIETQRRGEGGWRGLGRALGRLWEAGIEIDWSAWEGGWRGRGAPLPAYAFQRERYWVEPPAPARIAAPPAPLRTPAAEPAVLDPAEHFCVVEWRHAPLPEPDGRAAAGTWLVLGRDGGIGRALADALEERGETALLHDAADPRAALADGAGAGIILPVEIDAADGDAAGAAARACARVLRAVQAIASTGSAGRLWVVTRGAHVLSGAGVAEGVAASAVAGLARVAARELPEWKCSLVDLDPAGGRDDVDAAALEILAGGGENQSVYRDGERWVPRLVPWRPSAAPWPALPDGPAALEPAPHGGTEVAWRALERTPPAPGQVEVAVDALLLAPGQAPAALGVVASAGEGVAGVRPGDRVSVPAQGRRVATHVLAAADAAAPGRDADALAWAAARLDGAAEPEVFAFSAAAEAVPRAEKAPVLLLRTGGTAARPAVRRDGAYVVTGGLGALGMEVAAWLAREGAGRVVLLGRTPPAGETAERVRAMGPAVRFHACDVANPAALDAALRDAAAGGMPLRGVVHAAGVLEDGVLVRQDAARLERGMEAKVRGGWNLHRLTLGQPLDFFVCFSSMAAVLGSPGQGPYAAGNAFLDGLAGYRRSRGFPGLSLNWGAWAGGGMAGRLEGALRERLASFGLGALAPAEGIAALHAALGVDAPQLAVVSGGAETLARLSSAPDAWPLLSEIRPRAADPSAESATAAPADALERVRALAARVLRMPPERLDTDRPLSVFGFDSLMSVELRNALQDAFGVAVPVALVLQNPTLARLADAVRPAAPAPTAPGEGAEGAPAAWSPLVPVQPAGTRTPVFCVHPWAGVVYPYYDLARELGQERPFYGLQAAGLFGEPDRTVEEMASRYLDAVRRFRPEGPCVLAGWSSGAPVAFEMARRIVEAGGEVPVLLLLDPPRPRPSVADWVRFTATVAAVHVWPYVADYVRLAGRRGRAAPGDALAARPEQPRRGIGRTLAGEVASLARRDSLVRRMIRTTNANSFAFKSYVPRPYPGRVALFRLSEHVRPGEPDPTLGWGALAPRLELRVLPGHHMTFLRRPHVAEVARALAGVLDDAGR